MLKILVILNVQKTRIGGFLIFGNIKKLEPKVYTF